MIKTVLELKNIYKNLNKKNILNDINFKINEGEILGLIGPNGAGKTTTIKLILGLQKIDSGEITINGYNVMSNFEKAIDKVGAIVENPDFYMYLSGRDNLKLTANLFKDIDNKKIDEIVKRLGLENRINDKVSTYSLGMRQRLGIAETLLISPNLLILDEPTNGLDPEGIKELRDLLITLAKEDKIAILISSHNLLELENLCTNVCILQNGKVILSDSIEHLETNTEDIFIIRLDRTEGIEKHIKDNEKILENGKIEIHRNEQEVSQLIEQLLKFGYKIFEVKQLKSSLEEIFLDKTGGNVIE